MTGQPEAMAALVAALRTTAALLAEREAPAAELQVATAALGLLNRQLEQEQSCLAP